jgi:nicotinic acid phosphoribosyltransferase
VDIKKEEVILSANGTSYRMRFDNGDAREWLEAIRGIIKNRTAKKLDSNVVQIVFGDGTRAFMQLQENDTGKQQLLCLILS